MSIASPCSSLFCTSKLVDRWALTHEPEPFLSELAKEFTWAAATDRLIRSAAITRCKAKEREMLGKAKLDERIVVLLCLTNVTQGVILCAQIKLTIVPL